MKTCVEILFAVLLAFFVTVGIVQSLSLAFGHTQKPEECKRCKLIMDATGGVKCTKRY